MDLESCTPMHELQTWRREQRSRAQSAQTLPVVPSKRATLFMLAVVCGLLLCVPTAGAPLSSIAAAKVKKLARASESAASMLALPESPVPGVWRLTRIASLLGPTPAIFLYRHISQLCDEYEPRVRMVGRSIWRSFVPYAQPDFVGRPASVAVQYTAKKILRVANQRLRERAMVSRMQMDDDQYEFMHGISYADVIDTTLRVQNEILEKGSAKSLTVSEKVDVRDIVFHALR